MLEGGRLHKATAGKYGFKCKSMAKVNKIEEN
jgi:hypothetical protein